MKTKVYVWSNIGNTPITKRAGSFCDVLVEREIECSTPEQARAEVKALIRNTPHGYSGHFNIPDHPNQNTRSSFVSAI